MDWHQHFTYDEETGNLIWKPRPCEAFKNKQAFGAWTSKYAGQVAGCLTRGYIYVRIGKRLYRAHRIVWEMCKGPLNRTDEVDHCDPKQKANNRLSNLRKCTHAQNCLNRGANKNNKFGLKGVLMTQGRIVARIMVNGRTTKLGSFPTPEAAHAAYCAAAMEQHGEFARTA
jgi:hypothetical protein